MTLLRPIRTRTHTHTHTHTYTSARLFFWLSSVGHASLLPLFPPLTADALTALLLIEAHLAISCLLLQRHHRGAALTWPWYDRLYLLGLQLVLLLVAWVHPYLLADRWPFLARMASSAYCALGLVGVWARSYQLLWLHDEEEKVEGKSAGGGGGGSSSSKAPKAAAAAPAPAPAPAGPVRRSRRSRREG